MNNLKSLPVWVNWSYIPDPEHPDKPRKVPKNPRTGGNAQPNNPSTWTSYEVAEKERPKYDGIGFMFDNGICGIDLDNKNDNPEFAQHAADIIQLMNTYTEYSPSGNGYHLIFKCDISKIPTVTEANEIKLNPNYYQKNPHNDTECYFSGLTKRYFTYTGEAVNQLDIEDRTEQVLQFLDKYMKKSPRQNTTSAGDSTQNVHTDTHNIISIARKAKNGNKFSKLFDMGDISDYNNDDSSADLALCNMLAFYCQGNTEVIDQLFRQSKLYREKWERTDYRNSTISKAIALCNGEFYKPKDSRKKNKSPIQVKKYPGAVYINPFETPETRQRYRWNDIGVGNLFADTYKNISRYVPEAKAWYVYDGHVWKLDLGGVIIAQQAKDLMDYLLDCRRLIKEDEVVESWVEFVSKRMKKSARDTMISDAQSVYPINITEFDKDPFIFNCQNCTLNLRDYTMHSHRAEDFLSKISNVHFDKNAKCERWESFINEIMQGDAETATFLQKALGYTITGDTSEECFFILYGATSRNGKGTTMETTLHMLGDYGKTAQPESIAQKVTANGGTPTEDIARLKGARFVNMSEPDKGLRLNSALTKQLTGGDTVTARFLHQNSFEYRPEYKLFINTNHLPKVNDDSVFASGRVKLIPFERHFPENEQDKGLKVFFKHSENISGIFNWFIKGLKLMKAEGLKQPEKVIKATKEYREANDTIGLFIEECLEVCKGEKIKTGTVYHQYDRWCTEYGYSPKNQSNLIEELRKKGMVKRDMNLGNIVFNYALKKLNP